MSTIIKKQYETAKELLKAAEFNYNFYKTCDKTQEQFDKFYTIATSLLTIVGGVYVAGKVYQSTRDYNITEPVEIIEYTEEQKAQMWYEHQKQMDYDPQF